MSRLSDALCWMCIGLGLPYIVREFFACRRVTVLNYHDPSAASFASHLSFFSKHYNFISADQLAEALQRRNFSSLPPKALLITMDDGHAGNYALLESIEKFKVPVLIYAVAGVVGTRRHFWFKAPQLTRTDVSRLKSLLNAERLSSLFQSCRFANEQEQSDRHALSIEELRALQSAGVSIGSHTLTHPQLTRCGQEAVRAELNESRTALEANFGPVRHFAYPSGDWNVSVKAAVAAAGYSTARTIEPGFVNPYSDPLCLPNFGISDSASLPKAILQATGIWSFIKCTLLRGTP